MSSEDERPDWLPNLDLRNITQDPEDACTEIKVKLMHHHFSWIKAGRLSRLEFNGRSDPPGWRLAARMAGGATDFEHDSAYAFSLSIISPTIEMGINGFVWIHAYINPNPYLDDDFRVPTSSEYDPCKLVGSHICEEEACLKDGGPHPIVPEGYWFPPRNTDLFKRLRGTPITIIVGAPFKEDDK